MKRKEFENRVSEYLDFWIPEFQKPEVERKPLEDPMQVNVVLTCHTEGCPLQEMSYWHSADIPFDGVFKVLCAPCGRPIEDIDPLFEDDPDFRFSTRYPDGESWLKEAW